MNSSKDFGGLILDSENPDIHVRCFVLPAANASQNYHFAPTFSLKTALQLVEKNNMKGIKEIYALRTHKINY
jgi:hypothetical protein